MFVIIENSLRDLEILMNVNITWFEKNITNTTQSKIDPFVILNEFVEKSDDLINQFTPKELTTTVDPSRITLTGK